MFGVPVPTIDDEEIFDALIAAKLAPRRARLRAVRTSILAAYRDYVAAVPEVADLPKGVLDDEQAEALIHSYEVETKPMADLRTKLHKPVLLARCPFCGLGEASTLDHYLPKEQHPQFAVFSRNLIPCCSPCNTRKSKLVVDETTDVRLFLHPYFDVVPKTSFVRLSVTLLPDALGLSFSLHRSGGMTVKTFQHLQSHFRQLRLADRYRTMSLEHLRERRRALARFYGPARDAERVAAELLQDAEDFEGDFGPNHWRAILYRTLAAEEAFCDGGFSVLNRIQ
ncbi:MULTISPECIES: HNH endonuclease [unclassified Methylobacterium]|uniref:HNH endonuclease n=1 Tax=unclassified Methylobacterium TaxID=2615210 RepID=UPI0037030A53